MPHVSTFRTGRVALLAATLPRLVSGLPLALLQTLLDVSPAKHEEPPLTTFEFYTHLLALATLVLLGGVFAGLTLGLMGQDEVYLKVIASLGERTERKHAQQVLSLIGRGKHWVLVTLLLLNVITNETLPIVLDKILGGGWPAVVASTVLVVVFGEVIPQSISVRYGLQVGAMFAPFVLGLMYVMYPVAYPVAMLLDRLLGEDHGTVYKKSGLKTLVTLHRTMGVERLNQDEVTIILAVLDLKEKPVGAIMTPIDDVFTMSADTVLDQKTVEDIFNKGFNRIPIHVPGQRHNYIGMLLVRVLISYDPEDALPVHLFPLATLPETSPETLCLNILNYFQEGRLHMVVVSSLPGDLDGALGILTLEDVIEELIGEEIVDESDVYVDVHQAIMRTQPGPLSKRQYALYLNRLYLSRRPSLEEQDRAHTPLLLPAPVVPESPPALPARVGIAAGLKPLNPALNPKPTTRPFVHIKQPVETVGADSGSYGAVYASEQSAVDEQRRRSHDDLAPRSIPITGLSNGEFEVHHLYKTGGIIESVVNVKGVHKTIISHVDEEEEERLTSGSRSGSRSGSHNGSRSASWIG